MTIPCGLIALPRDMPLVSVFPASARLLWRALSSGPMTDPLAALQREADLIDACMRAGGAMFLAPSSYLGNVFAAAAAAALRARAPGIQIVAVDDVLDAQGTPVAGFDTVLPTAALRRDSQLAKLPAINCGYSIPTWLHFAQLVQQVGGRHVDLPELMYALDMTLIYQTGPTTRAQTLAHAQRFDAVRARLADALSVGTLDAVLQMALNGDRQPLLEVLCPGEQEYFSMFAGNPHPIRIGADEHYVDIGAYDGDTVRKFRIAARNRYAAIHAFEPDPTNYAVLQQGLAEDGGRTTLYNAAVADSAGTLAFDAQGTMGSRLDGNGAAHVDCLRLDDVVERATLLKMDVEGAEPLVLRGATELIRRCRPRLAITCYHHALDLLDIVAELDRILPGARLRLRKYSLYFYDTVLYVEWD
ncbi:FkbM family methyltransferase [Xanthomonas indica]|uniref:FkbM family methyltransferase n=1 Tax=Xanthomonas indica TaxID=2912242 RepID=A0AAU8I1W7_9XANT|nr:FkbM family methyltransferase [Xanthomonas indica]MCI2260682.1 FkbM family methyltransferase [Xanthomonas indica]